MNDTAEKLEENIEVSNQAVEQDDFEERRGRVAMQGQHVQLDPSWNAIRIVEPHPDRRHARSARCSEPPCHARLCDLGRQRVQAGWLVHTTRD